LVREQTGHRLFIRLTTSARTSPRGPLTDKGAPKVVEIFQKNVNTPHFHSIAFRQSDLNITTLYASLSLEGPGIERSDDWIYFESELNVGTQSSVGYRRARATASERQAGTGRNARSPSGYAARMRAASPAIYLFLGRLPQTEKTSLTVATPKHFSTSVQTSCAAPRRAILALALLTTWRLPGSSDLKTSFGRTEDVEIDEG
jgi:hypothetical protein